MVQYKKIQIMFFNQIAYQRIGIKCRVDHVTTWGWSGSPKVYETWKKTKESKHDLLKNHIFFRKQDSKNWDPWPRFVYEFDVHNLICTKWFDSKWFDSKWFDSKWFDSKWFDSKLIFIFHDFSIFHVFSIFHDFEKGWQNDEKWRKLKITTMIDPDSRWNRGQKKHIFCFFFLEKDC